MSLHKHFRKSTPGLACLLGAALTVSPLHAQFGGLLDSVEESAKKAAEDTTKNLEDSAKKAAADTRKNLEDSANKAVDDATSGVKKSVEDTQKNLEKSVKDAETKARGQVQKAVDDTAGKAVREANKAVNDATESVNDATKSVNDAARSINDVTKSVNDVTKSVDETSKSLNKAVDDVRQAPAKMVDDANQNLNTEINKASRDAVPGSLQSGDKTESTGRSVGNSAAVEDSAAENEAAAEEMAGFETRNAGGVELYELDINHTQILFTQDLGPEIKRIRASLRDGLVSLDTYFESPGLPQKPQFFLVTGDEDLQAVIKSEVPSISAQDLKIAVQLQVYVKDSKYFLVYKAGLARKRLYRLVFNEYAAMHLATMTPGGESKKVGWFHTGMAAYLSWRTEGEVSGRSEADTMRMFQKFYSRHFDPDQAVYLKTLEDAKDWRAAVQKDHRATYAQAALAFSYFVERTDAANGVMLVRIMGTPEPFEDAFARASGLRLGQFEKDLRDEFYTKVRELRK